MNENLNWYKVDNVAKVFLATCGRRDTRTLRVSCTLWEKIEPQILQEALEEAISIRPQFQVRIRRGFFWHYMEDTDLMPVVEEETDRICPMLYSAGKEMLHYKVSYFENRINLDLFHAISDGTGALEFLDIIVYNYLQKKYPGKFDDVVVHSGASEFELKQDSYKQYFSNMGLKTSTMKTAYHPVSMMLPYDQLQFFELHIPVAEILPKAKEIGVSLSSYLGARLMISLHKDMPIRKSKMPITISMPVNLRNYYPSNTSRNFFNNVNMTHSFTEEISLSDLAKEFDESLKAQLDEENIKKQMNSYETMEYVAPVRAVPLFIKQMVVRSGVKMSDKKVSLVLSNLGIRKPAEELAPFIQNYSAFCSSSNLFVTVMTYDKELVLGFSSPYSSTGIIKDFVRGLTADDISVKAFATEVIR